MGGSSGRHLLWCFVGTVAPATQRRRLRRGFRVPLGAPATPRTDERNLSLVCNFSAPAGLPPAAAARRIADVAASARAAPAVGLGFADYLRGSALPAHALAVFRDLKGAETTPNRALLYLTTACTPCHLAHLQSCWPESIRRARDVLAPADVLLYAGCGNHGVKAAARWADALVRLPNANVSLAWTRWNPGYQEGAMAALVVATRRRWFDMYVWVIRANPDVLVVDHSALAAAFRPPTGAYLYTCWSDGVTLVNTDFFAARPSAMNSSWWGRGLHLGKINSEASAVQVFRSSIENGTAVLTAGLGERSNGPCRTASAGVIHCHARCGQQPWGLVIGQTGPVATSANNAESIARHSPGGNASGNSRGPPERVEAEVAALKEKVAALEGELKGVRASLKAVLEARPKLD